MHSRLPTPSKSNGLLRWSGTLHSPRSGQGTRGAATETGCRGTREPCGDGRLATALEVGLTSKSSSPRSQPIPFAGAARANFAPRAAPPPPIGRGSPARRAARMPHWPLLLRAPPPQCGGVWRGGPHAASPAPAAPRGAAPPLPPESRVGHCHTTFQLRTPRCSPPPPRIGSPGPD